MAQYRFTIRGVFYGDNRTLPDLNNYLHDCGRHPQAGAKMKRQYQTIAINAIRLGIRKDKAERPIDVKYVFYEVDKKRDKGNIFAFADKVIEDALQVTGFIPNDNWQWIHKIESPEFYVDKDNPRIEVTLTEVEDEK